MEASLQQCEKQILFMEGTFTLIYRSAGTEREIMLTSMFICDAYFTIVLIKTASFGSNFMCETHRQTYTQIHIWTYRKTNKRTKENPQSITEHMPVVKSPRVCFAISTQCGCVTVCVCVCVCSFIHFCISVNTTGDGARCECTSNSACATYFPPIWLCWKFCQVSPRRSKQLVSAA